VHSPLVWSFGSETSRALRRAVTFRPSPASPTRPPRAQPPGRPPTPLPFTHFRCEHDGCHGYGTFNQGPGWSFFFPPIRNAFPNSVSSKFFLINLLFFSHPTVATCACHDFENFAFSLFGGFIWVVYFFWPHAPKNVFCFFGVGAWVAQCLPYYPQATRPPFVVAPWGGVQGATRLQLGLFSS